jgi:hypothetical protein
VLGVRRWRELVGDRKKWKDIVRQAKDHFLALVWRVTKNSPTPQPQRLVPNVKVKVKFTLE